MDFVSGIKLNLGGSQTAGLKAAHLIKKKETMVLDE